MKDPDATHEWFKPSWLKWESCKVCGVVRRADRKNKPCRGPVKIVLKEAPFLLKSSIP